ncbi:MAG: hypothetical protein FJ271_19475 [Planctomycetes bacterium]|nr:hypothetical protein [Planctomycetota bacterium]
MVGPALRVAVATTLCVIVAECARLDFAFMSAMTAHRIMAQTGFTAFQKGIERIFGRIVGVFYGLLLLTLFSDSPASAAGTILGLLVFFYGSLSGRMAYTFVNAGLLLAGIMAIGREDPSAAWPAGWSMILEVALGVLMADLVNFLSGAEKTVALQQAGPPLWPIQAAWLSHAAMMVVAVLLSQALMRLAEIPARQTLISVMILGVSADEQALIRKGRDRLTGALLGGAWGFASFLLLARLPYFGLLLALSFLGTFLAARQALSGSPRSYIGVQMGMVIPMVLLVAPAEFGTLTIVAHRLVGIVIAIAVLVVVSELWPGFQKRAATA